MTSIDHKETPARLVLTRLIRHLEKNSTLSNMSNSGPKADDFTCLIGRGENILEIVSHLGGIDGNALQDIVNNHLNSDSVIIDKVYLESLLLTSDNQKLIDVVTRHTGLSFTPAKKTLLPLTFVATDDNEDEFFATTPFFDYQIYKRGTGFRASIVIDTKIQIQVLGNPNLNWEDAVALCTKDYTDRLSKCRTT